jgi:membrane protease YdiL (CAAX protease family)
MTEVYMTRDSSLQGRSTRPEKFQRYLIYLSLTFLISWSFWLVGMLPPFRHLRVFFYIGGAGPFISTIIVLFHQSDKKFRLDYWHRLISFKSINLLWWVLIIGIAPILTIIASKIETIFFPSAQILFSEQVIGQTWWQVLISAFMIFLIGPLPEEMGWRGLALDGLVKRFGMLRASLLLGLIWATWHIPLYFLEGTFHNHLGFGSPGFWYITLGIFPQTLLMTWLYYHTGRSILSAVMFHFIVNLVGEMVDISTRAEFILVGLYAIFAVLVVVFDWRKNLINKTDIAKISV